MRATLSMSDSLSRHLPSTRGGDIGNARGEHDNRAKVHLPSFQDAAPATPFFRDPQPKTAGKRPNALAAIDIPATSHVFITLPLPKDMQGSPLANAAKKDEPSHGAIPFGLHAARCNRSDGFKIDMHTRGPVRDDNPPGFDRAGRPS